MISLLHYYYIEWEKVKYAHLEDEDAPIFESDQQMIQTDGEDNSLKELIKKIHEKDLTPTAKVVGIISRVSRKFCGQLKPADLKDEKGEFAIREFIPADGRYPNINLRLRNVRGIYEIEIS